MKHWEVIRHADPSDADVITMALTIADKHAVRGFLRLRYAGRGDVFTGTVDGIDGVCVTGDGKHPRDSRNVILVLKRITPPAPVAGLKIVAGKVLN